MSKNNLVVEREELAFTMSRVFDAPRELVWKVCTDPELVPKWWGPRNLTTIVDKMDVRVGGVWRYIQKDTEGNEYAFNGVYKEVKSPERLTYTFEFEPMAGHVSTDTISFEELPDGKTKITSRTTFDTLEDLEGMLQSGMEGGAVETWDRLEELVQTPAQIKGQINMRKVIYSPFVSLDGMIEGPNRELDWHIPDEELHRFVNEQQSAVDTHLYGRRMYEAMIYWETADQDPSQPEYVLEFAHIWKQMRKIVFSKTLEQVQGNARLVRDHIAEEIIKLKAQPGKDMVVGGANIASTFMRLGLIDEYRLFVHPVVLGRGTPMFPASGDKIKLRLVETRTFGSGVIYLCYQRTDEGQ